MPIFSISMVTQQRNTTGTIEKTPFKRKIYYKLREKNLLKATEWKKNLQNVPKPF